MSKIKSLWLLNDNYIKALYTEPPFRTNRTRFWYFQLPWGSVNPPRKRIFKESANKKKPTKNANKTKTKTEVLAIMDLNN